MIHSSFTLLDAVLLCCGFVFHCWQGSHDECFDSVMQCCCVIDFCCYVVDFCPIVREGLVIRDLLAATCCV